ncbi:MAG: peptidoglycan recognition family protein, partial [Verrucomicrobia bacterium]|nr:peptidoglycan recognition family protein [Verrucomicrobiota bacterium]
DDTCVQHLPTNEQGEHADFDGPGNNYSIGIEMCEHPGNSRGATIARTAKLTAYLMRQHGIPLKNVVPHYHWPRYGQSPVNKNCPIFLLDNGRPGRKWQAFLQQVNSYYRQLLPTDAVDLVDLSTAVASLIPARSWGTMPGHPPLSKSNGRDRPT